MKRLKQAFAKFVFCLRISDGWNSFYQLIVNSKRFSSYYKETTASGIKREPIHENSSPASPAVYHLKIRNRADHITSASAASRQVYLRTFSGDIQMFYDVMLDQSYPLPQLKTQKNLVIIDAGANIGMAALYFLEQYHVSKLYCIEPDAQNMNLLKMNLGPEILAGTVKVSAVAVSDTVENTAWENNGWAYNARLTGKTRSGKATHELVPTITMSSFMEENHIVYVDLLKMDVEGAEEQIFSGDLSWLKLVSNIIIEIHEEQVEHMIRNILLQAGFIFTACTNSLHSKIYLASRNPPQ